MLHGLLTLAAEGAEAEKSETLFYVLGCVFAAWAVIIGIVGTRSPSFVDGNKPVARAMILTSVVLAAVTMASVIIVSS